MTHIPDRAALQRLTGIKSPTLVIQGDGDLIIPTKLDHLMAGLIPDARIRIYPDAAHGFLFPGIPPSNTGLGGHPGPGHGGWRHPSAIEGAT